MKTEEIVSAIIKEQSLIIGEELAKSRALSSGVVTFSSKNIKDIQLSMDNPQQVISKIIESYEKVFGLASVAVCVGVIRKFSSDQLGFVLPDNFKNIR